jgi:hypothetical protein
MGKNIYRYELNLTSSDNSINPRVGHQITKKKGFFYLKNLAKNYQKSLSKFLFHQNDSVEKWISMGLWQKVTFPQILWQIETFKLTFHRKPIPLQLRLGDFNVTNKSNKLLSFTNKYWRFSKTISEEKTLRKSSF